MKKHSRFLIAGITWMVLCIYQFKSNNMFMVIVAAVITIILFALAVYFKLKDKNSDSHNEE